MSGLEIDDAERAILARIRAAKIRLRFDQVVVALTGGLKAASVDFIPDHETVIFTLTAPIQLPNRTQAVLEGWVRDGAFGDERREAVHGNDVRMRRVRGVSAGAPRLIGFVHNPDADAGLILDLAERGLLGGD